MGPNDQDGFEKLRQALPSMPAVVPDHDAELDEGSEHPAAEPSAPGPVTDAFDEPVATFTLQVLDDASGAPIAGVELALTLPDGAPARATTDARGVVSLDGLHAGSVGLTSAFEGRTRAATWHVVGLETGELSTLVALPTDGPQALALVEAHKVASGETLAGLAEQVGLDWRQLAAFNWGTSDPARINEHLHEDVGCTKTTADGAHYVFDDGDEPGLVHLPSVWTSDEGALDTVQLLRVSREPPPRRLTISFQLGAADQVEHAFPKYVLASADGSYHEERTAQDDLVEGDAYLQLVFEQLPADATFTLTRWHDEQHAEVLFADAPCADIVDQGRAQARGLAGGAYTGLMGLAQTVEVEPSDDAPPPADA